MLAVPLAAVPNQSFNIQLDGQNVSISLYTMTDDVGSTSVYMDLLLSGSPIKTCMRCHNLDRLLTNCQYTAFVGDFVFVDTQGNSDPVWSGLGSRWVLVYLEFSDVG